MSKSNEDKIDILLIFMKDVIEASGRTHKLSVFNFNQDGEEFLEFQKQSSFSKEEVTSIMKVCFSRRYIKHRSMRGDDIVQITDDGYGRAISVEKAKNYKPEPQQQNFNIGNIHGPTQIGNHNTQNVEGAIKYIIDGIDKSDATEEQKAEAKGLLQKALEHPVVSSAIGSSIGAVLTMLGG